MTLSPLEKIYHYRQAGTYLATSGQPTEEQLNAIAATGYQVVINLALHNDPRYSLKDEAQSVQALGLEYVHIPVQFAAPTPGDLERFFEAMDAHKGQCIWVHCAANYRVTAFVGLYRCLREGQSEPDAFALMREVWQPDEIWSQFIETQLRRKSRLRESGSSEPMEQHTLIVGGTGMLRGVSIALATRSKLLTSVARTAASLRKLDRELQHCTERHCALQLDWSEESAFLDALAAHCSAVGYPSLVVAWLHEDGLGPRIAARIGAAGESCRFFHVRSNAAADPTLSTERLAKAWVNVPVQHYEIILGFQLTSSGSRWLDNSEICSGVLTAIDRGERKTVVGVVSPWADRP